MRETDVDLRRIDQRIEVDLSDRTLRYYVHDELKRHFKVGVGTDATPTGTGTFYVWVKIHYASPYQPYGIAALSLSGFSPVLSEWPGAAGWRSMGPRARATSATPCRTGAFAS